MMMKQTNKLRYYYNVACPKAKAVLIKTLIDYFFLNTKVIYTLLLCKNDEAHSSKGILHMRLKCQARVQAVFT